MSSRKKTSFEKTQELWYAKLKESGLKDIEHADGSINSGVPRKLRKISKDTAYEMDLVQDYYRMAYHFLNEYKFESELEKAVWQYHTEGLSGRNITKILNSTGVFETNRIRVWKMVQKLDIIMKGLYLIP